MEAARASLLALAADHGRAAPLPEERERMARRIELGAELSEEGLALARHGAARRQGRRVA
jgi:hypothetical protein